MIGPFFLQKADHEDGRQRYLPENAWALLTESDQTKANTTKEKVADGGEQVAEWPDKVMRAIVEIGAIDGDTGLAKEKLYERAQELDVDGCSQMNKEELKEVIVHGYSASTKRTDYSAAAEYTDCPIAATVAYKTR